MSDKTVKVTLKYIDGKIQIHTPTPEPEHLDDQQIAAAQRYCRYCGAPMSGTLGHGYGNCTLPFGCEAGECY